MLNVIGIIVDGFGDTPVTEELYLGILFFIYLELRMIIQDLCLT